MQPTQYARCWADLDEAVRIAEAGTDEAYEAAIAIAARVRDEAEHARQEVQPSPWDGGEWAQCTVLMTRASLLLLRLRRGGRSIVSEWAGRGPGQPMPRVDDPDEPSPTTSGSSGVRERCRSTDHRILVVEPDPSVRRQLLDEASAAEGKLLIAATADEAAAIRFREQPTFIACHFPMPGAVRFIEELHRERFPVVVVTSEVLRAIATFGFEVPIVSTPISFLQILEEACELASSRFAAAAVANVAGEAAGRLTVMEVTAPPRRRDPRRE